MDTPVQSGEVLLFRGRSLVSLSIMVRTCLFHKFWVSHCGQALWTTPDDVQQMRLADSRVYDLISESRMDYLEDYLGDGKMLVYESTTMPGKTVQGQPRPCALIGEAFAGVQAHPVQERVDLYNGEVFRLPWSDRIYSNRTDYTYTADESRIAVRNAIMRLKTPYDTAGVALLGSFILKYIWPPDAADRSSCLCSKFIGNQIWYSQLDGVPGLQVLRPDLRRLLAQPSGLLTPGGMFRTLTDTGRVLEPVLIPRTKGN